MARRTNYLPLHTDDYTLERIPRAKRRYGDPPSPLADPAVLAKVRARLREGQTFSGLARAMGYHDSNAFKLAYRTTTGETVREYLRRVASSSTAELDGSVGSA